MTTYTTTAIATSSVDNTVTVASISNMIPGLPVTFSGVTFGGITTTDTYYIGAITYGYPTSKITLTSLPGGAVFVLTTATGSMTATWSDGGQQMLITVPPGENLNTAFTKINTNFDQIWAAGPVNSNIKISENTIYTLNTNGELILNPNGIGNIVANAHVVPDTTLIRNLGSPTKVWNELYVNYLDIANLVTDSLTIPVGNLHILGGNASQFLQTDGNGNLNWGVPTAAAGGPDNSVQYNNNGILDGVDSFTFNSNTNTVTIQNVTTTGVANLNYVGNIQISGGVPGYVLQTDGMGNLSWTSPTGNITSILDQQLFGDGTTTEFTMITPSVNNAVLVSVNGVLQIPGVAYDVNSDLITFAEPPLSTDLIDIRFLVFGERPDNHPGGADGMIQFNSAGSFGGSANLRYSSVTGNLFSSNISVSGNVTASHYYGDGSHLTGVTAVANTGTITFANNVISTSNANAAITVLGPQQTTVGLATGGNSAVSQLLWATNISAISADQIPNGVINGNTWGTQISLGNTGATIASNSVAGLKTWTFKTDGTLSSTGTVIAGAVSATGTITTDVDVSAVGNVSGSYIFGNIAFANGIPATYGDSNVYALLDGAAANIVPLANVAYSLGNATNQWLDLWVSNNTIYMNSVPVTLSGNTLTVNGNPLVSVSSNNQAELGNFTFNGNSIQNSNGPSLNNGSLVTGSTSGVTIAPYGNGSALLYNTYGPVGITTGTDIGNTKSWIFGSTGNLELPGGGMLGNPYGDVANSVGLQAGTGGYSVITSGDRQQFVQVDNGNVYIGTQFPGDTNLWTFDQDGNITLPSNIASINYANGQPYGGTTGPSYGNTEVATFLGDFGSNSISTTGTITSGNISAENVATNNVDAGNVSASGNITTSNFFVGDGRYISNISLPIETGNVTFTNTTLTGPSFGDVPSANSSIYIQPTVDSANVFQFTTDGVKFPDGSTQTTAYTGATYGNANVVNLLADFGSNTITTTGTISGGNLSSGGNLDIDGNATIGGNLFVTGNINFSGNVTQITGNSGVFYGNAATGVGAIYAGKQGFTPLPNTVVQITGDDNAYIQVNLQNTNHGNVASMELAITADDGTDVDNYIDMGIASSTWNGTQDNSLGDAVGARDGYLYVQGGASPGGNLILGTTTEGYTVKFNAGGAGAANTVAEISNTGISTSGVISATGNISGNYILGDGGLLSNVQVTGSSPVSTTGNVSGGNLISTGTVCATGNITANYFFGNGSQLTGLPATYSNSNVTTLLATFGSNTISTTGNISAGYLFGNASQLTGLPATYANSNVATFLAAFGSNTISTTGTITSGNVTGANILTAGIVSATSNITGGNILTAGIMSSTGNATHGNILTGGLVSATSNVTGGNILTAGIMSSTGNATHGNILTGGIISATGNITGGNISTGIISASGNVTAQNFIGNISITGNVTGTTSNVTLVAGSYSTVFDNTGVATFPGIVYSTGNINNTAFQVGNGAVGNCAVAIIPTAGTAANTAFRDYSTANSIMYFDNTAGSANVGGQFIFRGSNAYTQWTTINQYGVVQPTKPAFRVYGTSGTNIPGGTTITATNGATVDYNTGSYYNNTTGIFTAPVAGIYSVTATLRVGSTSGLNQASIQRNGNSTQPNIVAFWEVTGSTTVGHMAMAGQTKLAVGDTLRLQVIAGNVNFDPNDSWAVTFIG